MMFGDKMLAAVFQAPREIVVQEVPMPRIESRDALIRVIECGICGSDLHSYATGRYVTKGQVMGHEFVGEVAALGDKVTGLAVGDRVTGFYAGICGECFWCRRGESILCPSLFGDSTGYGRPGAFAEYLAVSSAVVGQNVWHVPASLDDDAAATVEPVAVAVNAVATAGVGPGDSVVVLGAGMIGNACMQAAKAVGAGRVGVVEVAANRLAAARSHGADAVCSARDEDAVEWAKREFGVGPAHFHEGAMVDVVIDSAGTAATISNAFDIVRSGGTIVFVGLPSRPEPVDIGRIVHKLPRVLGSLGGDFTTALEALGSEAIRTSDLVTHHFSLADAAQAFAIQADSATSIKVMIRP